MAAGLDPRIRLRHLSGFVETVRRGGVARAGAEIGMTQPAVSKAIAELEDILGVPLFDRSRRALAVTSFGEMFLRHAEAALASLRQGVESVVEARDGKNVVAFGALPTVTAGVVPRALLRFAESPLACRTLVESGPSPYLLDLLRDGRIDFVVGRMASPDVMDGLAFEQLYAEELAFVVRMAHPLAGRDRIEARDLAGLQFLVPPREAIIRPAVDATLIASGITSSKPAIETVSNSLARSYVLISNAVWIISAGVVERDLATGQLTELPLDVRATLGPIGITSRAGMDLSLPANALIACVRTATRPGTR